jgi:hypothetical protein
MQENNNIDFCKKLYFVYANQTVDVLLYNMYIFQNECKWQN